jgi:hypothetical protein
MNSVGLTQIITVIASVVAAMSAVWFANRNLRRELMNQHMAMITVRQKYFQDIRDWANKLSDTLSEAVHLCDIRDERVAGESVMEKRHRLLITLSSMI